MKRWIVTRGKLRSSGNLPELPVRICAAAGNDMPRSGRQPRFLCADHHPLRRVSADCWLSGSCTSVSSDLIFSSMVFLRFNNSAVSLGGNEKRTQTAHKHCKDNALHPVPFPRNRLVHGPREPKRRPAFCRVNRYPRNKRRKPAKRRVARGRESRRIAYRDWRDVLPPEFASRE